jgi:hypothetical protein
MVIIKRVPAPDAGGRPTVPPSGSPVVTFKRVLVPDVGGRQFAEFEVVNNSSAAIKVPVWGAGNNQAAHVGYEHQTDVGWQRLEVGYDSIPDALIVPPGEHRLVVVEIGVFEFQGVNKSDLVRVVIGDLASEPFRLTEKDVKRARMNPRANAGRMELVVAADELQDFASLRVRLDVRNLGSDAVIWDSKAAVFVFWSVLDEAGTPIWFHEQEELPRRDRNDWRKRFVSIAPGASVSQTLEFASGIKAFKYGIGIQETGEESITVYETKIELDVPAEVNQIRVRAIYERGLRAEAAFHSWFGQSVEYVGLPLKRVVSNEVVIQRANGQDKSLD